MMAKYLHRRFSLERVSMRLLPCTIACIVYLAQGALAEYRLEGRLGRSSVLQVSPAGSSTRNAHMRHLQDKYHLDSLALHSPSQTHSGRFLVRPEVLPSIQKELDSLGIAYQDHTADFHRLFQNDTLLLRRTRGKRRRRTSSTDHPQTYRHKFLSYHEIQNFLDFIQVSVAARGTGVKVKVGSIGKTFEGRDTPYIEISLPGKIAAHKKKPLFFIDAGIHGREWIAPAMAVEIINQLALNPDNDPEVDDLLLLFDWVIVPMANPDGYVFSFSDRIKRRMWRKSRTTNYARNPFCYGVDLNRNFGFQWNDDPVFGGSSDPCSMTFSGPHSFSEPESRNLRDVLLTHQASMQAYVSLHSFGQFFLYPWGFSSMVDLQDETDLHHVASVFADAMKTRHYDYHVGGTAKILYPAAGGSDDYVRGSLGIKYAYTIELPPHQASRFGFLLPENDVKNVVMDTWHGMKSLLYRLHLKLANGVNGTEASVL